MRVVYPRKPVFVAPNATELSTDSAITSHQRRTDFLYVGRLTEGKRPDLLLAGFAAAVTRGLLPPETRLFLVGEGPLKAGLRRDAERLGLNSRVMFVGNTFDSNELNDLYASSIAGVCGGYVGLNITQSLSRGVPFVYPLSANHSPEVTLARAGINAFPFDPPNANSLAAALRDAWTSSNDGAIDHNAIRETVIARYSIESTVAGFLRALERGPSGQDKVASRSTNST
jgi:glycosyltransferase involved in cell wall biosynthesis